MQSHLELPVDLIPVALLLAGRGVCRPRPRASGRKRPAQNGQALHACDAEGLIPSCSALGLILGGVDSRSGSFLSTIVLFKNRSPGFWVFFSERRMPGKNAEGSPRVILSVSNRIQHGADKRDIKNDPDPCAFGQIAEILHDLGNCLPQFVVWPKSQRSKGHTG